MNVYDINTAVVFYSSPPFPLGGTPSPGFRRLDTGAPFDPTTVTLFIRDPNKNLITVPMASLLRISTGLWSYQLVLSISGPWSDQWEGSGNCQITSAVNPLLVRQSTLIPG